jgi:hypothetical protein
MQCGSWLRVIVKYHWAVCGLPNSVKLTDAARMASAPRMKFRLYLLLKSRSAKGETANTPQSKAPVAIPGSDPVLVGAGDIASCEDLAGAEVIAKLLDAVSGTIFAVRRSGLP